ncbi:hypothetical protein ALC57_02944 [Trachymyrmex cornetzi]|uniref:HAT C-terminal dimerisation domain-containing protein n=1 Tax=Trachymyrmex cornetzi TaxID=471704 RepID=A0A151JMY3_9HYME|nr:hypothetical protein ALC57_02944 [Trachymyrmex cornetzi]
MIQALEKRFKFIFDLGSPDSKPFIISAISLPRFKLNWVPEDNIKICKELFLKEVDNLYCKNAIYSQTKQLTSSSSSISSSEEDFFCDINKKTEISVTSDVQSNIEVFSYLENKSKKIDILNLYPHVKQIFFMYNTSLPSSVPVERLFNCGQQILIPRRNRLSDEMFEKLLFLKNKDS